jgi:hypothetical protein
MHHVVDAVHRPGQAVPIAHIADEPAQPRVVAEVLADLILLQLIPREDDDPVRVELVQCVPKERLAERTGPTGHQNRTSAQHAHKHSFANPGQRLADQEI